MTDRPKRHHVAWTQEHLHFMADLRERGRSGTFIAQALFERFGILCHGSTIIYQCMRMGADLPPRLRGATPRAKPSVRNGHCVRPWNAAEDRQLLDMKAAGARTCEIRQVLNRSSSSITGRLLTLARLDARREVQE